MGRTFCGKTYFIQKLVTNNFFGNLKNVEWISYIQLGKTRKAQIQPCFKCNVEFHYPTNIPKFKNILKNFKVQSRAGEIDDGNIDVINDGGNYDNDNNDVNSFYGKNKKGDRLIVTDDVSGLYRSNKFASFLTITRKFGYHCVYIFHIIFSEQAIWRSIISQTNITNIFAAFVKFC